MKQHWVLDALEKAARERVRDEMAAGDAVLAFGLTVSRIRLLRDFYEARSGKPAAEITPAEVAAGKESALAFLIDFSLWETRCAEEDSYLVADDSFNIVAEYQRAAEVIRDLMGIACVPAPEAGFTPPEALQQWENEGGR